MPQFGLCARGSSSISLQDSFGQEGEAAGQENVVERINEVSVWLCALFL